MGEPHPWVLLQTQDRKDDIEVASHQVDVSSCGDNSIIPKVTFLLSTALRNKAGRFVSPAFASSILIVRSTSSQLFPLQLSVEC